MQLSPTSFRDSLEEGLLSVLWRHWSAVGVGTHTTKEDRCPVDLEALMVATGVLAAADRRLPNLAREWLAVNSGVVMKTRLERMRRHLKKLAKQHRTEFTWAELDELEQLANASSTDSSRRASVPPPGLTTAQMTLRNLFGINARADILLYFLSGATGSSAGIARGTWFDQKAVYRILESWSEAGVCARPGKASPGAYQLTKTDDWGALLALTVPYPRVNWGISLFTLLTLLQAASVPPRAGDAYLLSSVLRDLHDELSGAALPWNLAMPDPRNNPGEEYFQPAAMAVLELVGALADERAQGIRHPVWT